GPQGIRVGEGHHGEVRRPARRLARGSRRREEPASRCRVPGIRLVVERFEVRLSIVVPALDEAAAIEATLAAAQPARARGAEVIVVDGGSRDATRALAAPLADRVIES